MLYIVSTPIGNLQDISLRAISVLKSCDYILCEDTRHSLKLLSHFEIQKPLVSFHEWNEEKKEDRILDDLKAGKVLCLISDAGTPLLADPGFHLVRACRKQAIAVFSIPGASALLCALVGSGMPPLPFQFIGFLPRKKQERTALLQHILSYEGTSVCYESPERIEETLEILCQEAPERALSLARELTKQYETFLFGTAQKLLEQIQKQPAIGELVLLLAPCQTETPACTVFSNEFLRAAVCDVQKQMACSQKEAIAQVAMQLHISKKIVYNAVHLAL
jgi:16S rRNA (cytidine1402-2'-O)-methyltransferase